MLGDLAVTVHHQWPPPHVVAVFSSRKVEQREVSPISPSPTRTLCHLSALPLSIAETLSVPAASIRCLDMTLQPKLRLHAMVLIDLTTGALNYISVLPSPVPLRRRSSMSSLTISHFGQLQTRSLPPRAPPRPRILRHPLQLRLHQLLWPLTSAPLRRLPSP
jgi:hypothetical protein